MDRYLPKRPLGERIRDLSREARDAHATVEQGERAGESPPSPPLVATWWCRPEPAAVATGGGAVRVMDWPRRYVNVHRVDLNDDHAFPLFPFEPIDPVVQNFVNGFIEIVFSEGDEYGQGLRIGQNLQWSRSGLSIIDVFSGITQTVRPQIGSVWDTSSRAARLLGHVTQDGPGLVDDVAVDFATRAPFYDGGAGVAIGILGAFMRVTLWAVAPMLAFRTDVGGDSTMYLFDGSAPLEIAPAVGSGRSIRAVAVAAPDWRGVGSPVRFRREL